MPKPTSFHAQGLPELAELLPLLQRINRDALASRYPTWVNRPCDERPVSSSQLRSA